MASSSDLSSKINLFSLILTSFPIDIKENNPLTELSIFSEEEKDKLIHLKGRNILKLFHKIRKIIGQYLDENDKVIKIDAEHLSNTIPDYLYLILLLKENETIINYVYNIDIIETINNKESKGIFDDILIKNIIDNLISSYKQFSEDEEQEDFLNKMEEQNENELNKLKSKLKKLYKIDYDTNIYSENLDILYINLVINILINSGKIEGKNEEEKKFVENFLNEINIENIEITKSMCDKLFGREQKKYMDKYNISEPKDLCNSKIINFYYILCKYILKHNYYIYNIKFLLDVRNNILNILRNKKEELSELILMENNDATDKLFRFVINFMTDSEYYYNKLFVPDNWEILKYKRCIMEGEDYKIKTKKLIELNYGHFLQLDKKNNILIYDKNYEKKCIKKATNDIKNIIETKTKDDNIKNNISFVEIQLRDLVFNEINIENYEIKEKMRKKNLYQCSQFFEVNINQINKYIISGNSGIYLLKEIDNEKPFEIKTNNGEKNYIGAIKITDNIYAFYSNNNYNKGGNVLVIFDITKEYSKPTIIGEKEGKYSFSKSLGALNLINIDDTNKILLCACKNYSNSNMKNGILLIKIDVNNLKTINNNLEFFDTNDFEVNCFCSIYEDKNKQFNYILVGGLEEEKRLGNIKLYIIKYNIFQEKVTLEYIQDAIEDFEPFGEFDGLINNIINPKENNRDIIISCLNGSNYLFSLPDNNIYIKYYE